MAHVSPNGKFRAAVGQIVSRLGMVSENLRTHLEFIDRAKKEKCDLIVFPELSLNGYNLRELVYETALTTGGEEIAELKKASKGIMIVAGFVEESDDHRFYNSSFCIENGEIVHIHRKVYLPTYGMFEEMRYFSAGNSIRSFDTSFGKFGIAICEDAWHPSFAHILFMDGVNVLINQSASPVKGLSAGSDHISQDSNYWISRFYSQCYGVYTIFANFSGFEDGVCFYGHSQVLMPGGEVAATAADFEEDLLIADIDFAFIRESRIRFPVYRDERQELTLRELQRVFNKQI